MTDPHDHDSDEPSASENIDADGVIRPDAITGGSTDPRSPIDRLAQRAVDVLLNILRRANALAGGVLVFAGGACLIGYLLGIAALDGGLRTFWMLIGGIAAAWAIGSVLVAMWRLRAVRTGSDALVSEVRALIGTDRRSEQTVIETVETTEGADDAGVVHLSRQFFSLRDAVGGHAGNFAHLTMALASITTFPGLMALATLIGVGFAGLSLIFLLVLVF